MPETDSVPDPAALHHLADLLHQHGLATPALLLMDTFAPLSSLGGPLISAFRIFMPNDHWQRALTNLITSLQDAEGRDLLRQLLIGDKGTEGQRENGT